MRKIKLTFIAIGISLSAFLSYGFADNYFELSKNLDIFSTLIKELNTYYVDDTQPGKLMKDAIDGMLESLDPYTNYIPESQIEDFKFLTTGQYGGIGALIHKDSNFVIISEPYENFPAQKVGLKAGDIILEVDGKSVEGKNTGEISNVLKGQAGTEVKLTIRRPGQKDTFVKSLKRENIKINDVPYYGMLNEEVGYIKLSSFTQTASKEFMDAFKDLKEKNNMKQLVFDLRNNGGGLLMEAVNIVNTVIPKGKKVVETRGKLKEWDATYTTRNEPLDTEIPVVILVNGNSASASEIVAGTLQDYDRAVIVGNQTFGKGLVQQTRPLSYNAQLKVTVAKYYIPSGRCIQKVDYSNKKNGIAEEVPDSLITAFKTLNNNRPVFDGKGIKPDVKSEPAKLSMLSSTLLRKHHIFDFATEFEQKNESIADPKEYTISEEDYASFVEFLKGKNYQYSTRSERLLKELKEAAEKEKYFEQAQSEYEALEKRLAQDKKDDLTTFKSEISLLLENEIVSRYYFQNGRIAQSLSDDPEVLLAMEILQDKNRYEGILAGNIKDSEKH